MKIKELKPKDQVDWLLIGVMVAGFIMVVVGSSTACAQDNAQLQQELDDLRWEQRQLERDMQIQRYVNQTRRITLRQQQYDPTINERKVHIMRINEEIRQKKIRDSYKWDDGDGCQTFYPYPCVNTHD
jgi:peptidoglycan hydrolase CwlO-like protein